MKTLNTRTRKFSLTVGRIVMALVFATMIGGVYISPVFSRDNGRHEGHYKQQHRYRNSQRMYRQPPRHYYHPAPVYAPPPVVYYPEPYQSPGLSLIFPINIR